MLCNSCSINLNIFFINIRYQHVFVMKMIVSHCDAVFVDASGHSVVLEIKFNTIPFTLEHQLDYFLG